MARARNSDNPVIADIPFYVIPKYTGNNPPKFAIVREIDFDIRGEELWFFFSDGSKDINLKSYGGIEKLVDDILEGGFKRWIGGECHPEPPYSSPLSLKNDRWSYVIYVLSDKNWQFTRRGRPITAGRKAAHCQPRRYWHAHRVAESYKDADPGTTFGDEDAPIKDHCKVAFMMANGDTDTYDHSINLHVDLIYGGIKRRHMPIMIDPDVRYPGGSGVDGGGG